jgi:hypothetical protein
MKAPTEVCARPGTDQASPVPLLLLALAAWAAPLASTAQEYAGLEYTNTGNSVTITRYTGTNPVVYVPSAIGGLPVTAIGDTAFAWKGVNEVIIPYGVTTIGDSAFFDCVELTNVAIPNSVTSLGDFVFYGCSFLRAITIPDSVTNLGVFAFYEPLSDCDFSSCPGLRSVTLGRGLTSIGAGAFSGCLELTSITIPSSVVSIGADAFAITEITDFVFEGGPPNAEESIFYRVPPSDNYVYPPVVLYPPDAPGWGSTFEGLPAYPEFTCATNNGAITITGHAVLHYGTLTVPNAIHGLPVTSIGPGALAGLGGLDSVTLPDSVTNIGNGAFASFEHLTELTIPANVTGIGADAFGGCYSLSSVFFLGNAPTCDPTAFNASSLPTGWPTVSPTVYYLPGTTGWGSTLAGRPALLWNPAATAPSAQNGQLSFTITGTTNIPVVVEASADPAGGPWVPLQTGTLTNGALAFTDPNWTNYPARFYRIRSP